MILLIILLSISIIGLLKFSKSEQEDVEKVIYGDVERVTNQATFYNIDNCINKYFRYVIKNDKIDVKDNDAIITNKYNAIPKFYAQDMYSIDKVSNITAFVYGVVRENDRQDNYYLTINLDYDNNTFEIEKLSEEEYNQAKNNQIKEKYKQNIHIEPNEYNEINKTEISNFEILQRYFEDYKYKSIYNIEEAFKILDAEYRQKKFNNDLNNYKAYIQKNIDTLKDANIVRHGITKNGQFGTYIAYDNYNNYYKIIETGINEYTILLDNYNVETKEFVEKYNHLSDKAKIASIADKIIKLINTKSYDQLYAYVNKNFKNNYFKTQEEFEKYIQSKFFDNNIVGTATLKNEGDVYRVTIPYKESLSNAAEEREVTLNIRLGEETNFEFSFNMD